MGRGLTAVEYEYQREIMDELRTMLGGIPDAEWSKNDAREAELEIMTAIAERGETERNEEEKKQYPANWEEYCEIRDGADVDDRDAPNTYPYKKCSLCGERSSCGQYKEDDWVCEGCDEGECDECGSGLTADTHIFIYSKDGEEDVTVCQDCGEDMDCELREKGYTRDDDEKVTTPVPVPEPEKKEKKKVRTYCFECENDSGEPVQKCSSCEEDVCLDCFATRGDDGKMVCMRCDCCLKNDGGGLSGEKNCFICDGECDEQDDYYEHDEDDGDYLCCDCANRREYCERREGWMPDINAWREMMRLRLKGHGYEWARQLVMGH